MGVSVVSPPGGGGGGGGIKRDATNARLVPENTGDDFIIGSDRKSHDPADTAKNYRMFFDKAKGAFRVGVTSDDDWDDVNVGAYSHAEGAQTRATASGSHAEGANTQATGNFSHAEGNASIASGAESHAEGKDTTASGINSHAEGNGTTASGAYAHAEGRSSTASASSSHAEGDVCQATGQFSHAEGYQTIASANGAHAEGGLCTASGAFSHAEGVNAAAIRRAQRAKADRSFAVKGDAQLNEMVVSQVTTDAIATVLLTSGTAVVLPAPDTNVLTIPASRAHTVRIEAVARRTDVQGEMAGFVWEGMVGRDATGNARIIGTPVTKGWSDTAASTWALTVQINTTDATNNYLEILGTGQAGKTIRWVAGLYTTEVGG